MSLSGNKEARIGVLLRTNLYSNADIGRQVGCSREYVRQIAEKMNRVTPFCRVKTKERHDKIFYDVVNGKSVQQVADKYRISETTVYRILEKNNYSMDKAKRDKFIKENAKAIKAVKNGASIRSSAKNRKQEYKLGRVLKILDIKSQHGRWNKN